MNSHSNLITHAPRDHQPVSNPKIIDLDRCRSVALRQFFCKSLFGLEIWSLRTQKKKRLRHRLGRELFARVDDLIQWNKMKMFVLLSVRWFLIFYQHFILHRSCKSTMSRRWFAYASPATRKTYWKVLVLKCAISPMKTGPSHRPISLTNGSKSWSKSELDTTMGDKRWRLLMILMCFSQIQRESRWLRGGSLRRWIRPSARPCGIGINRVGTQVRRCCWIDKRVSCNFMTAWLMAEIKFCSYSFSFL